MTSAARAVRRFDALRPKRSPSTICGASCPGEKGSGGSLTAQGEAGWIDSKPQVQLDAKLQRLRASIRTDRQLTVSGDVRAILKGDQAELTGKLLIDQARILLPEEGTPQLGDDVVVRTASGAAAGQKATGSSPSSLSRTGQVARRGSGVSPTAACPLPANTAAAISRPCTG